MIPHPLKFPAGRPPRALPAAGEFPFYLGDGALGLPPEGTRAGELKAQLMEQQKALAGVAGAVHAASLLTKSKHLIGRDPRPLGDHNVTPESNEPRPVKRDDR